MNDAKMKLTGDNPRKTGHQATYSKTPKGLTKASYLCTCHGQSFESRPILRMHVQQYHKKLRTDLASVVAANGLGQPAWERLPGETVLEFNRFLIYLKMPERNIYKVAAVVKAAQDTVNLWCGKWAWRLRAQLWDQHIAQSELAAFEVQKRKSAQSQAKLGRRLQEVALAGASALLSDADRVAEMSGHEISKMADVGTKIERLANSDPTSITDDRGSVRLVWEGPRPAWAPAPPDHQTIEGGPLTQKVLEAGE